MATQTLALAAKLIGLDKLSKDLNKGVKSWTQSLSQITIIAQGVASAVSKVMGPVVEQVEIAAKFRTGIDQTRAAIDALGQDGQAGVESMLRWTDTMALATGQSQDTLFELGRLALTMSNSTEHIEEMTKAAAAMEAAGLAPAETAMKALARTLQGDSAALKRYGVDVSNVTKEQAKHGEVIGMVANQFMPQLEAKLQSAGGQWERLGNIIGDRYLETVGMAIVDNDAFAAGLRQIGDDLAKLAPDFEDMKGPIQDLVLGIASFTGSAAGMVVSMADTVGSIVEMGLGAVSSMLEIWSKPLEGFIALQTKIAEGLGLPDSVVETWKDLGEQLDMVTSAPRAAGKAVKEFTGELYDGTALAVGVLERAVSAIENADSGAKAAAKSFKKMGDEAKAAAASVMELSNPFGNEPFDINRLDNAVSAILAKRAAMYDEDARLANEAAAEVIRSQEEMFVGLQEQMVGGFDYLGSAAAIIVGQSEKAGEALKALGKDAFIAVVDSVTKAVQAYAIQAAAAQFAANAMLPGIGLFLAAGAAGAASAMVKGLLNQLPGYAMGGTMRGIPGQDNQILMARVSGDEQVEITTRQQQQARAGSGGGAAPVLVVQPPLGMGSSAAVTRQMDRAFMPWLREAHRTGRLDFLKGMA